MLGFVCEFVPDWSCAASLDAVPTKDTNINADSKIGEYCFPLASIIALENIHSPNRFYVLV